MEKGPGVASRETGLLSSSRSVFVRLGGAPVQLYVRTSFSWTFEGKQEEGEAVTSISLYILKQLSACSSTELPCTRG